MPMLMKSSPEIPSHMKRFLFSGIITKLLKDSIGPRTTMPITSGGKPSTSPSPTDHQQDRYKRTRNIKLT